MSGEWEKVREMAKDIAGDVATLRDELRVKLHLGAMDAKDGIEALQPELEKLEQRLFTAADETALQIHLGVMNARDKWKELEPKLSPAVKEVGELADKAASLGQRIVDELAQAADREKGE